MNLCRDCYGLSQEEDVERLVYYVPNGRDRRYGSTYRDSNKVIDFSTATRKTIKQVIDDNLLTEIFVNKKE